MTAQFVMVPVDGFNQLLHEIKEVRKEVAALREPQKEWLTVNEYADAQGVKRQAVMRRIAKGHIETKSHNGETLIRSLG